MKKDNKSYKKRLETIISKLIDANAIKQNDSLNEAIKNVRYVINTLK